MFQAVRQTDCILRKDFWRNLDSHVYLVSNWTAWMHTYTHTHTPRRPSLVMSDCRAQDDSSLKIFPPTTSTIGCDSGYIKMIFFSHPLYVPPHSYPHPPLKLAPNTHKGMRERRGSENGEEVWSEAERDTGTCCTRNPSRSLISAVFTGNSWKYTNDKRFEGAQRESECYRQGVVRAEWDLCTREDRIMSGTDDLSMQEELCNYIWSSNRDPHTRNDQSCTRLEHTVTKGSWCQTLPVTFKIKCWHFSNHEMETKSSMCVCIVFKIEMRWGKVGHIGYRRMVSWGL